jgi:hypothetical protein
VLVSNFKNWLCPTNRILFANPTVLLVVDYGWNGILLMFLFNPSEFDLVLCSSRLVKNCVYVLILFCGVCAYVAYIHTSIMFNIYMNITLYQSHHFRSTVQDTLNASTVITFLKISKLPPLG